MTEPRYRLAPDVVLSGDDASQFLTDMRSGELYALNDTSALILRTLREGASEGDVVAVLQQVFPEARADILRADVHGILATTLSSGMVQRA